MSRKASAEPAAQPDFEQTLQQLEELVERLERGDLPLGDALALFEQGVSLTRQCHERLAAARARVEILLHEGGAGRIENFTGERGPDSD